jgi:hypothetical protein
MDWRFDLALKRGRIPLKSEKLGEKTQERAVSSVVEQETLNLLVGGSNPSRPISHLGERRNSSSQRTFRGLTKEEEGVKIFIG